VDSIDVDLLVVGSGAGALTAAITAHDHGGKVLVVEKSDMYGGTSATSGGGIWIPCNHLMAEHGEDDTAEAALEYLEACIGDTVSKARLKSYVENAPKMLKDLEDHSDIRERDYLVLISLKYPEYHIRGARPPSTMRLCPTVYRANWLQNIATVLPTSSEFETVPVGMLNVSTTLYKSCCLRSARSNSSWGIF